MKKVLLVAFVASLLCGNTPAHLEGAQWSAAPTATEGSQRTVRVEFDQELAPEIRTELKTRLIDLGLTSAEAEQKLSELTPADLAKLGQNPDQLAMAGIKDTTLILIAVILILPGLLLLLIAL